MSAGIRREAAIDTFTIVVQFLVGATVVGAAAIEFFDRVGLPTPLASKRRERIREMIADTLDGAGLKEHRGRITAVATSLTTQIKASAYTASRLDPFIRKYQLSQPQEVGSLEKAIIERPIDFMAAAQNSEDIDELAKCLAAGIIRQCETNPKLAFTALATPVNGNVTLAHLTAHYLKKNLILLNPDHALADPTPGETAQAQALLVHDVIFTGRRIARMINVARRCDIEIQHVCCLVERTDKCNENQRARNMLTEEGVELHSVRKMNADEIHALLGDPVA